MKIMCKIRVPAPEWAFLQPPAEKARASCLFRGMICYGITKQCGLRTPFTDFVSSETIADLPQKHILKQLPSRPGPSASRLGFNCASR
ncbi:hypothetical protein PAHAL_8G069000 [Panicum hallii]|uniref:Uncharacterized protein n=1 Tax=Panicum hallii TaxID=206008 RepID=A0A2T8I833_9POAL|nr:hypothetical protein PAHAL_8G069000 [Panicum hallii]